MCTGFFRRGNDLTYGFNLDIDPNIWNYRIYRSKRIFTVAITVGKRVYYTHGINREGHFSNLPYMNDYDNAQPRRARNSERVDLLTDRYLRNQYSFEDVRRIVREKQIVNIPEGSMHSLIGDIEGHALLLEPAYGYRELEGDYAAISNFPLLTPVEHYEPWFGKERYDAAMQILENSSDDFSAEDGLRLLESVKQEGPWATRVSFVYSRNQNCVYFVENNDFANVQKHAFG